MVCDAASVVIRTYVCQMLTSERGPAVRTYISRPIAVCAMST